MPKYTCKNGHIFGFPYKNGLSQIQVDVLCAFCHPTLIDSDTLLPYLDFPKYRYFRSCSVTRETYDKLLLLQAKKYLTLRGKDRWIKMRLIFRESGIILIGRFKHQRETHVLELRPWALDVIERKQETIPNREIVGITITRDENLIPVVSEMSKPVDKYEWIT